MSARKIKTSWWVDFRYQGHRYRIRSPENSRAGASAYESFLRHKLVKGEDIKNINRPIKPTKKLFADFVWEWFKTYVKVNNKPSTIRAKSAIIRTHLIPHFGDLALDEITSVRIEQYKAAKLNEERSPKSINNHLSVLRTCLTHACDWGYTDSLLRIKWLKTPPQKFKYFNKEESALLLSVARNTEWYDMVLCGLHTGMRLGELCGLRWPDVDLNQRKITVQHSLVEGILGSPKNNKIRYIPISNDLYDVLIKKVKKTGYVFTHKKEPVTSIVAYQALQRICQQASLGRTGWHVLRHTFASMLVASKVPMRAVQMLLGHSTILMTERYAHLAPSSFHEAIAVLN